MTPNDPHAIVDIGSLHFNSWADSSRILNLEVELATNEAAMTKITLFDPDPDYAVISRLTRGDGLEELPARVWLGFGSDLGEPVFEGLLSGVEREGTATVVRISDRALPMRKLQRTEYHNKLDDLQIIEKLAKRTGLGFEGPEEKIALDRHKSHKQEATTDWDEALRRASEAGLVLYVRRGTLYAKEAAKTAATPLITLAYREDFLLLDGFHLAFRTPENLEGRPARVETRGRGRAGRRLQGASSESERGRERLELKRDLRVKSRRYADKRAEARKALEREHAFTGSISVLPTYTGRRADVRDTVEITRLPALFNGKYLCDRVTHLFAPGELTMELDLYRDIKA